MDLLLEAGKKNLGKLVKATSGSGSSSKNMSFHGNNFNHQNYGAPFANGYPGQQPQYPYHPNMNQYGYPPAPPPPPSQYYPYPNTHYGMGPPQSQPPLHNHPSYYHQQNASGYNNYTNPSYPPPPNNYQQNMNVRPRTSKSTPLNALDLDHDGMVTANGDSSIFVFYLSSVCLKQCF